jgi:glycosyltransferase involved in cell wall biosynthesis
MPKFSVVLATRDRPGLFSEALNSVIAQTFSDFDVIVVNDGSSPEHEPEYERVYSTAKEKIGDRLKVHRLVRRPKGHGQSYSINFGVDQASGEYMCFLDDDDMWTDSGHLARAATALDADQPADLYMANQRAYLHNEEVPGPIWLDALEGELLGHGVKPSASGVFKLGAHDLMQTSGFCHLNCFVVRRELFQIIGGMDEGIRWECDRDLFLRLIDKSNIMLFHPAFVSRHNVPDPAKTQNMTTSVSMLDKRLLQIRVLDKAALFSAHPLIRAHALTHKGYALKKIVEELMQKGQWQLAAYYAREALGAAPTMKWAIYTLYCIFCSTFRQRRPISSGESKLSTTKLKNKP